MVAAVMAVVHMAACMAVPPPAWPPALPSRTFVLVVVLVLVLGDSAIGDANGALGRGRFWATAPPPSAPFRFPNPSCSRMAAACEFACRIHRRQTPGSSVSCMRGNSPRKCFYHGGSAKPELRSASAAAARRCEDGTGPQANFETARSFVAGDDDEQALCGAEASVPEFSVVFRFRAYS